MALCFSGPSKKCKWAAVGVGGCGGLARARLTRFCPARTLRAEGRGARNESQTMSVRSYIIDDREKKTFLLDREVLVSGDILRQEMSHIFGRCWIYVGHASELKKPGDFRSRKVAGRPVIFCATRRARSTACSTPAATAAPSSAPSARATRGASCASITAGPTATTARSCACPATTPMPDSFDKSVLRAASGRRGSRSIAASGS